jgi:hypothetical protein
MRLNEMLSKLQSLNIAEVSVATLNQESLKLADELREQLLEGRDNLDGALRKYRNAAYAQMKNAMNSRAGLGNPDLKLTGATHRSITIVANGNNLQTKLNDIHGLEDKYSEGMINPFILSPKSKAKAKKDYLQKAFIYNIKQRLK